MEDPSLQSSGPKTMWDCTVDICPIDASIYGFRPSLPANAVFIALYSIATLAHTGQLIVWRKYSFSIPAVIGSVCEVIGYAGRLMLNDNPFSMNGFLIQIICLTLAPAFYSAAIYFCIADIIRLFGEEASRLKPQQYAWIFIPCDLVSLILQGTGGGMAAVSSQDAKNPRTGTNIMVAGLAFQVFSLLVFIILTVEYVWRARQLNTKIGKEGGGPATSGKRLALFGIPFSVAVLFIFIRCVYRVAELSNGWSGDLIKDEPAFIALEGAMVAVAALALNVGHPKILSR